MKLGSFIAGMGVGAVAALVFAPKSGEDTRQIFSEKVEQGKQYAKGRAQEIRSLATDTVEQGKEVLGRQKKAVAAAAHAAKDTYTRESQTEASEQGKPAGALRSDTRSLVEIGTRADSKNSVFSGKFLAFPPPLAISGPATFRR